MTYEEIVQWAVKAYPPSLYTSYADWHDDIEADFLAQGHYLPSDDVDPLLEREWLKSHKFLEPEDEHKPIIPPEEYPPEREPRNIGEKLSRKFDRLPQDAEFTPRQFHSFYGSKSLNYNTLRRELQEFVAQGRLQRVKRGLYRIAP